MKTCIKCKEEKPLELFSKNKAAKDGRQSNCKGCEKEYMKEWRRVNRERYLEGSREYDRQHRKQQAANKRNYYAAHREDINRKARVYGEKNKQGARAHDVIAREIKHRGMSRGECSRVDDTCYGQIEFHHPDYDKPLEGFSLCKSHHQRLHEEERKKTREWR